MSLELSPKYSLYLFEGLIFFPKVFLFLLVFSKGYSGFISFLRTDFTSLEIYCLKKQEQPAFNYDWM